MRLISHWDQELAQFGNKPGMDEGDVIVELAVPVDGMKTVRCPTGSLEVGAEGGQVIGLFPQLADGRHLFIPWSNVTGIFDAPAE